MNFSKISRVMMLSSLMGVFLCGVNRAEDMSPAPEVVTSTEDSKATDGSALPVEDSNLEDMSPAPDVVVSTDDSTINEGSAPEIKKDDKNCKDLGSFTVTTSLLTQQSHFGAFKDENGWVVFKDITDKNKDDASKVGECKSYKVTYNCIACCYPDEKPSKTESESVESAKEDSTKLESANEAAPVSESNN